MPPLDYRTTQIRAAAALTTSYVAGTVIGTDATGSGQLIADNQLVLYVKLTSLGNMTSSELKIEFSNDQTDWFQETLETYTSGVAVDTQLEHSFASAGNYRLAIPLKDKYVRVSSKGTGGTGAGSSLAITAIYGTA